jgi:hypothetical protein
VTCLTLAVRLYVTLQIGPLKRHEFSAASDQFAQYGKRPHSEVTSVIRTKLFLMMTSVAMFAMATVATAQTQGTNDPQATAPVQYNNGNGSNAPVDCGLDDNGRPLPCQGDVQYADDNQMYASDNDSAFAPDYYAYQDYQYYPPFYAGVSLWPYGGYGYWPGYAWGGWGYGYPYYGFGIGLSFGFGFGFGFHDHFHGPWRYDGHGHYWDNHAAFAHNDRGFNGRGFGANSRGFAGQTASSNFANGRSFNNQNFNRGVGNTQAFGGNRTALRSSSYYSNAHGVANSQSFNRGNFNSSARSGSFATNNRGLNSNPHVGSMPSRGYANQNFRANGSANRSYSSNVQRGGYGVSSQHYGSAGYAHYAGNVRSATYARSNASGHSGPVSHSSGGGGHSGGGGGESHHH